MVPKALGKMGATERARERMFKAVMKTVMLYGSGSWVIIEVMMKLLEAFQHQIARRLMGKTAKRVGEER